jgi:hypothetical protein
MVEYRDELLFPFSIDCVWKLLQDHLDDSLVVRIHPLVKQQRTVSRRGDSVVVDRTIDARGKLLSSQWQFTPRPPGLFRWEVLGGNGPYAAGSWMENAYSQEAGGTRIWLRGSVKITALPFFIPQRPVIRQVLDTLDAEDQSYLRG